MKVIFLAPKTSAFGKRLFKNDVTTNMSSPFPTFVTNFGEPTRMFKPKEVENLTFEKQTKFLDIIVRDVQRILVMGSTLIFFIEAIDDGDCFCRLLSLVETMTFEVLYCDVDVDFLEKVIIDLLFLFSIHCRFHVAIFPSPNFTASVSYLIDSLHFLTNS